MSTFLSSSPTCPATQSGLCEGTQARSKIPVVKIFSAPPSTHQSWRKLLRILDRLGCFSFLKVREARSASRALSVPILNDRSTAKRRETTANDRLFMVNSVSVGKD